MSATPIASSSGFSPSAEINTERKDSSKPNILVLDRITKAFGQHKAVDNLSLEIREGEIFTLLGPSGCGKTTTLRQIAGLEHPDEGKIIFRDSILASTSENVYVAPHKRKMGMVFQSYAIWPHLTVYETVAYPLKARKVPSSEIRQRVMNTLELVGLKGMENRPGPALSGGQQQRVALARALVYEPEILLLDEPFSNLDVKLREQMRIELKLLQRRVGITVILVTHDQLEALSLSDRIALMNQGRIEQVGKPKALYEHPKSEFSRDFIGKSIVLNGTVESVNDKGVTVISQINPNCRMEAHQLHLPSFEVGQEVSMCIRPEDVSIVPMDHDAEEHSMNELEGVIDALLFIGDRYECHIHIGEGAMLIYAPRAQKLKEGKKVALHFPPEVISVWPKS